MGKLLPVEQIGPLTIHVNNVLLAHSHARSSSYYLWLLMWAEWNSHARDPMTCQSLKYLIPTPLQKYLLNPDQDKYLTIIF